MKYIIVLKSRLLSWMLLGGTFLVCPCLWAQSDIKMNGKGKLLGGLPDSIPNHSQLQFKVSDPDEGIPAYEAKLKLRLTKVAENLDHLLADADKLSLLSDVYGIKNEDIVKIENEIKAFDSSTPAAVPAHPDLPDYGKGDSNYFAVKAPYLNEPVSFDPSNPSPFIDCLVKDDQTEWDFLITKTDPFRKLTYAWLTQKKTDFKQPIDIQAWAEAKRDIDALVKKANESVDKIESYYKEHNSAFTDADLGDLNRHIANLVTLKGEITDLTTTLKGEITAVPLQQDKQWVLEWLWYQEDTLPSLNPLPFGVHSNFGPEPDKEQIGILRDKIAARDSYIKNPDFGKLPLSQVDAIVQEKGELNKTLGKLLEDSVKYAKALAKNDSAEKAFLTLTKNLNSEIVFVGPDPHYPYFMRHHNARAFNELMNKHEASEYLEDDRVVILAHNVLQNENETLQISFAPVSSDGSPIATTVVSAITLAGKAVVKTTPPGASDTTSLSYRAKSGLHSSLIAVAKSLRQLQSVAKEVDYLSIQTNPDFPTKENPDKDTLYHSIVLYPPNKVLGPKTAKYYINRTPAGDKGAAAPDPGKDSKDAKGAAGDAAQKPAPSSGIYALPADTFSYRINKLYRVFPMAGLAYTFNTFNDNTTDTTGHQTITSEAHARFIVGLKVYLRKTDIRSGKLPWQTDNSGNKLWLSRISVNAAVDVAYPLNNFFGGASLDILPGVSLGGGAVFNRYSYMKFNSETAIESKTLYRTGFYASLTTDLTLVASLLKLVNL